MANDYTSNFMISFEHALQLIQEHSSTQKTELIETAHSLGRVVSREIQSPISVPNFDNTAMDGYAINAIDLEQASESNPIKLKLAGISAAGETAHGIASHNHSQNHNHTNGTAWKIMTGAPVPNGYDSIIPIERTQLNKDLDKKDASYVSCFYSANKNDNIRPAGSDFEKGETITQSGKIIEPQDLMAFASLGLNQLEVYKKPRIAVITTGKELVDDLNAELDEGKIYNSNRPYLLSSLKSLPVTIADLGTNHDDEVAFKKSLQKQLEQNSSIIISCGAVSMGDFDFIPRLIKELGGEIIFHKVKIKPGKPLLFARFNNGTLYFGLPGNPISTAISLRFFVITALRKMLGMPLEKPQKALLDKPYNKTSEFRPFLKARTYLDHTDQNVKLLDAQESYKIKPLIDSNSWLALDEGKRSVEKHQTVNIYPLHSSLNK
jgi:molybdopterin molybdotransferase